MLAKKGNGFFVISCFFISLFLKLEISLNK